MTDKEKIVKEVASVIESAFHLASSPPETGISPAEVADTVYERLKWLGHVK